MVRRGEVFSDTVEFHCADFEWAELFAEHGALLESCDVGEAVNGEPVSSDKRVPEEQQVKWDEEYQRHADKFHPIKNYIVQAFPELEAPEQCTVLEAGCGSGSCLLPLVRRHPRHRYYAFDFSATALRLLQRHPLLQAPSGGEAPNVSVFQWDMVGEETPPMGCGPEPGSMDFCLLTFVLSACTFDAMPSVLHRLKRYLKPDGRILFRDYGILDCAHLRFLTKRTRQALFVEVGFLCQRIAYHCVQTHNRKTGETMRKVFVNGVFRLPRA